MSNIRQIPLPSFQDMRILEGSKSEIEAALTQWAKEEKSIWCSIENTGEYEPGLTENLYEFIKDSQIKIINCHNRADNPAVIQRLPEDRKLAELDPIDVFKLMLKEGEITGENAEQLLAAFNEIETAVREDEN